MRRAELLNLKKKYRVTTSGNMKEMANGLFRIRATSMNLKDLESILYLLDPANKLKAQNLLSVAELHDEEDFHGLWKKRPKALDRMSRVEIVRELQGFRDAWEKISDRSVDLGDDRLASESTKDLKKLLSFYYTDQAKRLAEVWINNTLDF